MITIAWLPGDGVGQEVTEGPIQLLNEFASALVRVTGPWPVGSSGFREVGAILPSSTLSACQEADAVLLGAVGADPHVDVEDCPWPERALLLLRRTLDLRVSEREVLDPVSGDTITVVRNLLGGAYVDESERVESDGVSSAVDSIILSPARIDEVAEIACAKYDPNGGRPLLSVDKASVYATSRLWRSVVTQVGERHGVPVEHMYVDRAAFEFARAKQLPDIVVTEGLFGDILTDLLCGRLGSPALCGSASISPGTTHGCRGLFEPAHGSAPRRAGQDRVNPTGAFLALALLLETFRPTQHLATSVRSGLREALSSPALTYDLSGECAAISTSTFNQAVLAGTRRSLPPSGTGGD